MRVNNKVLKIRQVQFPTISFIAGNGEYRNIDIRQYFRSIRLGKGDFGFDVLKDKKIFETVSVEGYAITWKAISKSMVLPNGKKMQAYFQLDPLQTIQNSTLELDASNAPIGEKLKQERIKQDLSQEELGEKIGSSKHYISKVENSKTDLEFKTLQKLFEVGLGKKVHLAVYSNDQALKEVSNSVLRADFVQWLEQYTHALTMIEGINETVSDTLKAAKIVDAKALSEMTLPELLKVLSQTGEDIHDYQFLDAWLVQARYLVNAEWSNLISLQRLLSGKLSKVERLARRVIRGEMFWV